MRWQMARCYAWWTGKNIRCLPSIFHQGHAWLELTFLFGKLEHILCNPVFHRSLHTPHHHSMLYPFQSNQPKKKKTNKRSSRHKTEDTDKSEDWSSKYDDMNNTYQIENNNSNTGLSEEKRRRKKGWGGVGVLNVLAFSRCARKFVFLEQSQANY